MSDPSLQTKSNDSILSVAADFVRVLWSPTAVFRRRRETRTWRVLFVLWVILTLLALPMFFAFLSALGEVEREPRLAGATAVIAPIAAFMFVLFIAFLDGAALLLGSTALGRRLPISRAVVIAAFSSLAPTILMIPAIVAFFGTGQHVTLASGAPTFDVPAWIEALTLSLGPLAPESRPFLVLLLSAIGIPAFWQAALHAIGAREIGGVTRAVGSTAPVFWAAAVAVMLVGVAIVEALSPWFEEAARAAGRAAAEAADTIRVPARAP